MECYGKNVSVLVSSGGFSRLSNDLISGICSVPLCFSVLICWEEQQAREEGQTSKVQDSCGTRRSKPHHYTIELGSKADVRF
eukprot:3972347-Amphidinium_carterae.1